MTFACYLYQLLEIDTFHILASIVILAFCQSPQDSCIHCYIDDIIYVLLLLETLYLHQLLEIDTFHILVSLYCRSVTVGYEKRPVMDNKRSEVTEQVSSQPTAFFTA